MVEQETFRAFIAGQQGRPQYQPSHALRWHDLQERVVLAFLREIGDGEHDAVARLALLTEYGRGRVRPAARRLYRRWLSWSAGGADECATSSAAR